MIVGKRLEVHAQANINSAQVRRGGRRLEEARGLDAAIPAEILVIQQVGGRREELRAIPRGLPWRRRLGSAHIEGVADAQVEILLARPAESSEPDTGGTIVEKAVVVVVEPGRPGVRESREGEIGRVDLQVPDLRAGQQDLHAIRRVRGTRPPVVVDVAGWRHDKWAAAVVLGANE